MNFNRNPKVHFEIAGHCHELTFSCYKNLPLLAKDRTRLWLADAISHACHEMKFSVIAYVFMPNHVHLIVFPKEEKYSVSRFLQKTKQQVSKKAKAWLEKNDPEWMEKLMVSRKDGVKEFRFWQRGGGYDRNVVGKKALKKIVDYIHNNPVRAELLESPVDWKWSSAGWYNENRGGVIKVEMVSL